MEESLLSVDEFMALTQKTSTEVKANLELDLNAEKLILVVGACLIFDEENDVADEEIAITSSAYESLLTDIEEIPVGDPFWDNLDDFFRAVAALKTSKQKAGQKLAQLVEALEKLHTMHGEKLEDYFQLPIAHWETEQTIEGKEEQVLEQTAKLSELLQEHERANREQPGTMWERQDLNNRLQNIEVSISALYEELSQCFFIPDPELDPDPDPDINGKYETVIPENGHEDEVEQEEVPPKTVEQHLEIKVSDEANTSHEAESIGGQMDEPKEEEIEGSKVEIESAVEENPFEEDAVLEMIRQADLAGAYWRSVALESQGQQPSVEPWLIQSMQTSRWLLKPSFRTFKDVTFPQEYYIYGEDRFVELTTLGCGLIGALVELASNGASWLFDQESLPNLQRVIQAVREFTYLSIPLRRKDLLIISSQGEIDKMIVEASQRCKSEINKNAGRRFALPRVNRIWKDIFDQDKALRGALEKVASDQRNDIQEVVNILEQWSTQQKVIDQIQNIDSRMRRKKDPTLADYERDRLIRVINDVLEAAEEWVALVKHINGDERDWAHDHVEQLTIELKSCVSPALHELEYAYKNADYREGLGLKFVQDNLKLLMEFIFSDSSTGLGGNDGWYFEESSDIEQALGRRLLWFPELALQDNGLPTQEDLTVLSNLPWEPNPLWTKLSLELHDAWLKKQDYRFLEEIRLGMGNLEIDFEALSTSAAKQQQGSRDTLEQQIRGTVTKIEGALVNGVISEEQRNEWSHVVESIDPPSTRNFSVEFAKLQNIDLELDRATQIRMEHLNEIWDELEPRLEEVATEEDADKLRELVNQAIQAQDTRVMDEYLANVREHLESNEQLTPGETRIKTRNYLQEFFEFRQILDKRPRMRLGDAYDAVTRSKGWATHSYGEISPKHLEQTLKAFEAWRNLNQRTKGRLARSTTDLFTFLGFTLKEEVKNESFSTDPNTFMHLRLKMDASDQARPFPQFGSLAEPVYDVLLVWERPGADNIGTAIHDARLDARATILLYFGRIGETARQEITRMTRRRGLPIAILDETLFLYLTGQRDAILQAFLRCSVPYGTVIPYTPRVMGDVPPEIFYGRHDAVLELQRRDGSCLVYGGRQMGKSALLRHVQRRAHNPERHQYAWLEDVKNVGDGLTREEPSDIWGRLWNLFTNEGLLTGPKPDNDEVIQKIGRLMQSREELEIIVMLDEADHFLNNDALKGFETVTQLRKLMMDSGRRFKVIFAGLQHVQRFQSLPNQPLAHFGDPILVGPLEGEAATALVREPLEALGFELDDARVYTILSFTNYHPGLIQFFCYHLLERLYKKTPVFPIPHRPLKITKDDVESIYLQDDVRDRIRERFEWTLALDPRYQVVTWAMIVAQTEDRDSFSRKFSVGDLFDLVSEYWPAEFDTMSSDEFRGLLRELSGLGVLISTPQGQYRLKSPNLVRLMGTEADIERRLFDFIDKPAYAAVDPDSFHALIDEETQFYSVFTFEQARSFDLKRDFRVITASQALGWDRIEGSLKHLYSEFDKTRLKRINIANHTKEEMLRSIAKEKDKAKKDGYEYLVFYQIVDKFEASPLEAVRAAYEYYQYTSEKRNPDGVSFYFVFNPLVYWDLLRLDTEFIDTLDSEGAVVKISPWNKRGIGQRLDHLAKISNEDVRELIFGVSGGWPYLIDEITHKCGLDRDPQPSSRAIQTQLAEDEEFVQLFLDKLEVPEDESLRAVLRFLVDEGEVDLESVSPDWVEASGGISVEECQLAMDFLHQFGLVSVVKDLVSVNPVIGKVWRK